MNEDRDDDLLRRLGRLAAEEEVLSADDQELELLCAGQLPDDRLRRLEARAEHDPDLALRLAAYRPLPPASRSKIAEALVREMAAPPGAQGTTAGSDARRSGDRLVDAGRKRARPVSARASRWGRGWAWGSAAAAAAAAAVMLWIGHWPSAIRARPALPSYALAVSGGERELRDPTAPAGAAVRLRPDSRLELVLRPATAVAGPVAVQAFLARGEAMEPLPLQFEISPEGAARAAGSAAELFGSHRGRWQLRLIVQRSGAPGGDALSVARDARTPAGAEARRADVDLWLLDAH